MRYIFRQSSEVASGYIHFNPAELPAYDSLSSYGSRMADFYGTEASLGIIYTSLPLVVCEEPFSEWKVFRRFVYELKL